jgi:regulator of protease activity HflC (stomatin/prohibitin superfamily)
VVSVQYSPIGTDQSFYDAYYKLTAPEAQMRAYVEDIVRSSVPKLILDDVFLVRLKERGKKYACGRTVACSMV